MKLENKTAIRKSTENEWIERLYTQLTNAKRKYRNYPTDGYTLDEMDLVVGVRKRFLTGFYLSVASSFASLVMLRRIRSHGLHWINWQSSAHNWMTDTVTSLLVGTTGAFINSWYSGKRMRSTLSKIPSVKSTSSPFGDIYCPLVMAEYEKIAYEVETANQDTKGTIMFESFQNPRDLSLKAIFDFCNNCEKHYVHNKLFESLGMPDENNDKSGVLKALNKHLKK